MQRILVLNPKGGSGKTTVATNLASYYASLGDRPLLSDNDLQGSSTRRLKKRKPEQAFIHGIAAFDRNSRMTRAWQMRIPADAAHVVVDTPAAILAQEMPELTKLPPQARVKLVEGTETSKEITRPLRWLLELD